MKIQRHYIIRFNDLSDEKKQEIRKDLIEDVLSTVTADEALEIAGSDKYDLERIDSDNFLDIAERGVDSGVDKSWCELEIVVSL